ncbi:hypothetical protein HZH66_012111 [Vespula vulgaris]|uniref:Uncharacterized protein n=1 Tax=Vespula vulgaris TaxID=7454 RepID=A0A834MUL0_VESVU|nr:hypothetical protein HZH66_012111 [Vespula vulgaris]
MGDGSLGRAVFQRSPGGVFRGGSCEARRRRSVEGTRRRPPSSSLSYPGAGGNDDARSPGSGGTPGPLSQQAPTSLDSSDPVNLTSVAMTDHANGHARVQSVTGGNTSSRHHPIKIH